MPARMIAAPLIEPVSLEEMKAHLRIDHSQEDDVVISLTVVARAAVERFAMKSLITQTFRMHLDHWPETGILNLPNGPVQRVEAVRVRTGGSWQVVPATTFEIDADSCPARLVLVGSLPIPDKPVGGIEVDVVVGYGDTAADVPAPLRQAVKLLAARWYENRGDGPGAVDVPDEVLALTAAYRTRRLVA